MSNNINVKPLMFPITLDPFSGYSYGKGEDTKGNSRGCVNVIDDENNLNNTVPNTTFNHPLGKSQANDTFCFHYMISLFHHLFGLLMVYKK